jgi:hypothetical protein
MSFEPNEIVILNGSTAMDLSMRVGQRATVLGKTNFLYQDYDVEFDDGEIFPVLKSELNKLTEEDKQFMEYIFTGNTVIWNEETVQIVRVDYLHRNAEIKFNDDSEVVVSFDGLKPFDYTGINIEEQGTFTKLGLEIGSFTDDKNKQYGSSVDATYEMMKVLMDRYTYDEDNYLIPKSLVKHMLLTVRMMDKQNRIFNNPSGKGDSESPYRDLAGYSLIGVNMVEGK